MLNKLTCITFVFFGFSLAAQAHESSGVHYSGLNLKVRAEAKHNEFRIPSNAVEAAYGFCQKMGFKKPITEHFEKVNDEWQVQNVICTNQREYPRSLQQAAKAYIAKHRLARGLNVEKESQVLANYMIVKEDLFKEGQTLQKRANARKNLTRYKVSGFR